MQGFYPSPRNPARIRPETRRLQIPPLQSALHNGLVGDPRLALSLFLFPKQVGRCLPMSPREWLRDSESHGACVLMRHARRLRLPSRRV